MRLQEGNLSSWLSYKLRGLKHRLQILKELPQLSARIATLDAASEILDQASALTHQINVLENQVRTLSGFKSKIELGGAIHEPPLVEQWLRWKEEHIISDEPLVSICVATFNRAPLLIERCLSSLLAQSYHRLEIVVVGDGCTDDSAERVAALNDPRVRWHNLPKRGIYPSQPELRWMVAGTTPVNVALSLCSGEFITHLDDDDEHLPQRVEKLVLHAKSTQSDFVFHPFWAQVESMKWVLNEAVSPDYGLITTSSVFYRSFFKCIAWDPYAYRQKEPGDWNRFRKILYFEPAISRFPEPLLHHYRERDQHNA